MNALALMARAAADFRARLMAEEDCAALPSPNALATPDTLRWDNILLRARTFRRAHVETFDVPGRLSVLHVCVFPHLDDPTPIFGFDMVAGSARVTGIFLDLSPVGLLPPVPSLSDVCDPQALAGFATPRSPPEWGDIFSADLLAVRPDSLEEVGKTIALAMVALNGMLRAARLSTAAEAVVAAGQARYIAGQRRNEHTLRMLAGFIGHAAARRFIDEVLFPAVDKAWLEPT